MTDINLTQGEMQALMRAMGHFGQCNCLPGRMCAGHQFLNESDRGLATRIDKLLWIRRTADAWQTQEWTGTCPMCGEVGPFKAGADRCLACHMTRQMQAANKPARLPW